MLQAPEGIPTQEKSVDLEKQPASPALKHRIALGAFDLTQPVDTTPPTEVSRKTFDALHNRNVAKRQQDADAFAKKINNPDHPLSPEDIRHEQMQLWGFEAWREMGNIVNSKQQKGAAVFLKLLDLDTTTQQHIMQGNMGSDEIVELQKQFYDRDTHTEGAFYKKFCTGNMNENLANALTVDEMRHLKTFLTKWMLGSDEAFDALIVLRQTMDDLKSPDARANMTKFSQTPTSDWSERDKKILTYYQEGLEMKNKQTIQQPLESITEQKPQGAFINMEEAQKDSDKAKRFVFEQVQLLPSEERSKVNAKLIESITDQMTKEKWVGQGKMKATIQEMNDASGISQEIPTHEGNVIFLPKNAGRVVALGDIHGDLKTVKQVLEKEHVLEDLTAGKPVQVVFMGDLIDRGTKDTEVMEAILSLKYLFPDHITIMKADHETAGGIKPHEFPQHLIQTFGQEKGQALNMQYVSLFNQLPRMVFTADGKSIVHGGPATQALTMDQYAHLSPEQVTTLMDGQITWNDPIPDNRVQEMEQQKKQILDDLQKILALHTDSTDASNRDDAEVLFQDRIFRLGTLEMIPTKRSLGDLRKAYQFLSSTEGFYPNMRRSSKPNYTGAAINGPYYYARVAVQNELDKVGAVGMLRAHQVSDEVWGGRPDPMGNLLETIHTTGLGSDESAYKDGSSAENNPRYAVFDLSKPASPINPATDIRDVWK